ncbi:MAG: hypothetical protein EPN45_17425 [Rhizobiaceae bacterium]|nr:MAG: hypothetical protein EPN45_17425 [Rhizobiaceae bacterium]
MTHHKQGTPDGYYPVDGKTWYPIEEPERRNSGDGTAKFIAVAFALLTLFILWRVLVLWVNDTPWALWIVQHVASAATWVWSLF